MCESDEKSGVGRPRLKRAAELFDSVTRATVDLYWSYIPLVILAFILLLSKKPLQNATADMLVVTTLLFGEGMSKVMKDEVSDRGGSEAVFLIGVTGLVFSLVLLSLVWFADYGGAACIKAVFVGSVFSLSVLMLWVSSFIYGVFVRARTAS